MKEQEVEQDEEEGLWKRGREIDLAPLDDGYLASDM